MECLGFISLLRRHDEENIPTNEKPTLRESDNKIDPKALCMVRNTGKTGLNFMQKDFKRSVGSSYGSTTGKTRTTRLSWRPKTKCSKTRTNVFLGKLREENRRIAFLWYALNPRETKRKAGALVLARSSSSGILPIQVRYLSRPKRSTCTVRVPVPTHRLDRGLD